MQRRQVRLALSWNSSLSLFIVLSVLDAAATWLAMQVGLPEGNYVPSMLLRAGGPGAMYGFKAASVMLVTALMLGLSPYFPRLWRVLRLANWFMGVVVALNVVQILTR